MSGGLKNGIAAFAGFALAVGFALPAQGQHPNRDQRQEQRQAVQQQRREVPRPTRQDRSFVRTERPQQRFSTRQPAPAYTPRSTESRRGYSQGREVVRPPETARPGNRAATFSEQNSQPHREVPRPPARGQERNPKQFEQRGDVARPPAPQPRSAPVNNAPARGQEVARPPQTSASQGREVPRPPNAAQRHGGDWLRKNRDLSPADQQKALQSDPQFRKLPTQQQQRLVNRLNNFNSLPPEEQQRRLNRIETWEHLTPQQKSQARQLASQWQQVPQQRRQMMKTAIGDLRAMPPDQRERVLESDRFKGMFSDQERNMLRETTKLPLAPAQTNVPRPPQE
jgi:Protein of unknown function (DUF3106)